MSDEEEVPEYELQRRERLKRNLQELQDHARAQRPDFNSFAKELVYGGANRPNENNKNTEDTEANVPSDPEFDPKDLDETSDAHDDDDENGDACKDKGANSSKTARPTKSLAKRIRSRTSDASTTRITRRTRSMPEPEGVDPAEATENPTNNSPPGSQTSKDSNSSPEGRNSATATQAHDNAIVSAPGQGANSGQIAKAKGKRRPYMGHGLNDYSRRNGKMKIEFTEGKPRPLNPLHASALASECGVAVRQNLTIPLHWKEFKTEELKNAIPSTINVVAGKFDMDRNDEVAKDMCTTIIQKSIRQERYRLKRDYFTNKTVEEALATKPPNLTMENWTRLVHKFADERYQELCQKNQKNREGVKLRQKTGSRCYVAHRNSLKQKYNNQEPGAVDFFKESHTQKKSGTMSAEAQAAYDDIDRLRRESQSEGGQPRSDVDIVQHVMKEKSSCSTYLATLGYSATSRSSTSSTSTARIHELEARLEQQEKEAREANEKHEHELTSRLEAQQLEIEELKNKQHEELEKVKKAQQDQLEAFEKRQQEVDSMIGFLVRRQSETTNK